MLHWHFKAPQRQDDPSAFSGPREGEEGMADPAQLADSSPLGAYEALRDRGERAVTRGDLAGARSLLERALALAEEIGDPDLRDRALCNLAALLVETGDGAPLMTGLRQVLMRNRDELNCYLAAYALARAHDLNQDYKKAIFYARIGLDRVQRLDMPQRSAMCHNLMGNLLLAESHLDEACAEYERALALTAELSPLQLALLLDNVGYCRLLRGRHIEGFGLVFRSLRILRRLNARGYQRGPHISLAFGYLEIGRYHRAVRHGFAALRLAEEVGDDQTVKNALYLLGEAASEIGSPDDARRCWETLQRRFYPGQQRLADALMTVGVRRLLNLRA
jgi:tetratricopeptide (TPR) repeat protein